jgi:hypothetical protein
MRRISKTLALFFSIIIVMSCLLLAIKPVNAESPDGFIHELIVMNPNNSTTYDDTMPLNFTIYWGINFPSFWMNLEFSYFIDDSMENHTINKSWVAFSSSSSSVAFLQNSLYNRVDAAGNTVSNSLVDVTNLTNGRHKLTISANGTFDYDASFVVPTLTLSTQFIFK